MSEKVTSVMGEDASHPASSTPSGRRRASWFRSWGQKAIFYILGVVTTIAAQRMIDRVFPSEKKELRWCRKMRNPSKSELEKLEYLRRDAGIPEVLCLWIANTGDVTLDPVTITVDPDSPIIAHDLIRETMLDSKGRLISDSFSHFAYEELAVMQVPRLPPHVSFYLFFVVKKNAHVNVLCEAGNTVCPESPWVESDVEKEAFSTMSFTSAKK